MCSARKNILVNVVNYFADPYLVWIVDPINLVSVLHFSGAGGRGDDGIEAGGNKDRVQSLPWRDCRMHFLAASGRQG